VTTQHGNSPSISLAEAAAPAGIDKARAYALAVRNELRSAPYEPGEGSSFRSAHSRHGSRIAPSTLQIPYRRPPTRAVAEPPH